MQTLTLDHDRTAEVTSTPTTVSVTIRQIDGRGGWTPVQAITVPAVKAAELAAILQSLE